MTGRSTRRQWLAERRRELIAEVRQYAVEHYTEGWDAVVEAWDDSDIDEQIGRATTLTGAIRKFDTYIDVRQDRQADARNSHSEPTVDVDEILDEWSRW